MLFAVGGESRRIVLGEILPDANEQDQDSVQDVAAQWLQENSQEIRQDIDQKVPTPQPRITNIPTILKKKANVVKDLQMETQKITDNSNITAIQKTRKLIPVDFDLKLDEDDEYDEEEDISISFNNTELSRNSKITNQMTQIQIAQYKKNKAYDLATQCSSKMSTFKNSTIKSATTYFLAENNDKVYFQFVNDSENSKYFLPENNAVHLRNSDLKLSSIKKPTPKPRNLDISNSESSEDTSSDKKISNFDKIFLEEKLSLTLEEIVHIRSVLTKAELESLPAEGRVKEDVEKRRICFLCLKTRFGLLGPWGQRCRLCERTVCVKCYSKMRIPTDRFAQIPVLLLSPGLVLSPPSMDFDSAILNESWIKSRNTSDSAPTSPAAKRYNCESRKNYLTETLNKSPRLTNTSESASSAREDYIQFDKRMNLSKSASKLPQSAKFGNLNKKSTDSERDSEWNRSVSMIVCHDCRMMVVQIIKSSRITRANLRNNVISRLTLNLSPAYV